MKIFGVCGDRITTRSVSEVRPGTSLTLRVMITFLLRMELAMMIEKGPEVRMSNLMT